ncbi:Ger(x)C family spore germination protein [Clostridiaceae bacterium UIB06]|uniref:Ger(X)C family spore germination protein n=1 Tax=Clostridium thailandense TaxID=2794346 RepID=A0A949TKT3_9CLOT|nr:Ger(x)C family spore germination protein [Clostridium thailandense]MBV7274689.1 Ger(x)C family spore germination protein [Clostridium thailandense]MCH5137400.1 Ger(x)C family spore germination protein [Clostridiaceae bacterium UIB06]
MKKVKSILLSSMIFLNSILFTGCWNYRETDKLSIVAGAAIDKDKSGEISMTAEILEFSNERESKASPRRVTIKGKTVFDAARNGVSVIGRKLYWSHAKVFIVSEQVAREGILKVVDWIVRDSETRANINILVAKGHSAKEILKCPRDKNEARSFQLERAIVNQRSTSKATRIQAWEIVNNMSHKGVSVIVPVVELESEIGKEGPNVVGTAIFKKDKLVGFLNGEETKDMLFVQNKVKGGVLVRVEGKSNKEIPVSLEIFNSKTKVKPVIYDNNITFNININITAAIDEIGGSKDFIDESGRKELEESFENMLKSRIERLIARMQKEYNADIFGLGIKLKEDNPKEWKKIEDRWEDSFQNVYTNVDVSIYIRNSAILSEPLEIGE